MKNYVLYFEIEIILQTNINLSHQSLYGCLLIKHTNVLLNKQLVSFYSEASEAALPALSRMCYS